MKKQPEIARQANLVQEAYAILYYWINFDDIDKVREKQAENYKDALESFNRKFDMISGMFHYVTDHIKADKERVEYYFKVRNQEFSTYAALALLWDIRSFNEVIPSYQDRVEAINAARRIKEYAILISDEEAANTPDEELSTLPDLIAFIETSPYELAAKWEAIKIFNNQQTYYNEVSGILSGVIQLLKENYSTQIAELSQEFYEYWSGYQKEHDIIETINDTVKIAWEMSEKGAVVLPVIFFPFSFSISLDDIKDRSEDIILVGIMMDHRFALSDQKIEKEDVVEIGKLLSDKSKVDILEFVSKKPCYGKELANALSLSTATISYHVNTLLKIGFLKAEVISNKVYYCIEKKRISACLDDVKEFFTKLNT